MIRISNSIMPSNQGKILHKNGTKHQKKQGARNKFPNYNTDTRQVHLIEVSSLFVETGPSKT